MFFFIEILFVNGNIFMCSYLNMVNEFDRGYFGDKDNCMFIVLFFYFRIKVSYVFKYIFIIFVKWIEVSIRIENIKLKFWARRIFFWFILLIYWF